MKIGIDGNEANVKQRVGSGQYTYELLKQFARIFSKKFLVCLKDQPISDLPRETENFKYEVFGPKKFWTQFALPLKLTFKRDFDVFFSPVHYGPRFSKIPYVVTIHDLSYLHFPKMFKKDDLLKLTAWSKYSIKNSSHIIAPSQTTKDDIVKNYKVLPSKITVIHEGCDESRFKPQPESRIDQVKKKYKIIGDYIIFVGTLQPRKNLERLIEAFNIINGKLKIENGKLSLLIVGKKGWFYESIFQKVKDLKLGRKVIFADYVPDDDLPSLIAGARVYVLPSLWEGFGIPVVEAQACGVPVVVSNTSSLPEIIGVETNTRGVGFDSSGVSIFGSGILVDPESVNSIAAGIKKALDPRVRSDLVKKGFLNIKRFSWKTCAQETLKVLEKAVGISYT